jgi:hypothetical protein
MTEFSESLRFLKLKFIKLKSSKNLWVKSNFQNIPKVVEVSKGNKRRQVLT